MARKPSVILTPTEKKLGIASAKEAVKTAKVVLATTNKARKDLDRAYAVATKQSDKDIAAANKALSNAESDLVKLNPPAVTTATLAVPSPTT